MGKEKFNILIYFVSLSWGIFLIIWLIYRRLKERDAISVSMYIDKLSIAFLIIINLIFLIALFLTLKRLLIKKGLLLEKKNKLDTLLTYLYVDKIMRYFWHQPLEYVDDLLKQDYKYWRATSVITVIGDTLIKFYPHSVYAVLVAINLTKLILALLFFYEAVIIGQLDWFYKLLWLSIIPIGLNYLVFSLMDFNGRVVAWLNSVIFLIKHDRDMIDITESAITANYGAIEDYFILIIKEYKSRPNEIMALIDSILPEYICTGTNSDNISEIFLADLCIYLEIPALKTTLGTTFIVSLI